MRITRYLAAGAAVATLSLTLAACGGGGAGSNIGGSGSSAKAAGHEVKGGTVTVAEAPGGTPNFIFPIVPATNEDGYNTNLQDPLWPDLVYIGQGGESTINPAESADSSITYSDNDKKVTIVLKPWKWSDGTPITSRDFTFFYNLVKAAGTNWWDYVQGLFPDDVTSVQTPNASTVVLNLTRSYNPAFFTQTVLTEIQLMPQQAWDKTSATGKIGNYDETAAGAKAVLAFLQKEGGDMATFASNPLWQTVYGPWKLSAFSDSGYFAYVPNTAYSGPDKPVLQHWINVPYTTDTAELNALRAGGSITVGYLPLNDLAQAGALKAEGYSLVNQPVPGVAEIVPNLYNAQVGPLLRPLYIRQAMEDLINRQLMVSKIYGGYADPGNGPVPVLTGGPWVSPQEKAGGPYPYSPSKAIALLKAHGWKVNPQGVSTCQSPGSGPANCGAGITAGEDLQFVLTYSSGVAATDEQEADIQATEELAGIKITLKSEPFNTVDATVGTCFANAHPAAQCGWQLADYGYNPYGSYPAGDGMFNTDGNGNDGGYSSPEMDSLINATEYGAGSTQAFWNYENYAAQQLPWLWLPNQSTIWVYKKNLAGFAPVNPYYAGANAEIWYFTSGS
jgi:peptide/nickel transport system substrate-binding protein